MLACAHTGTFVIDQLGPYTQASAGGLNTCALSVAGVIRCWGGDFDGESSPGAFVP